MNAKAIQLLGRLEKELLLSQQEVADARMDSNDATTRDALRRVMVAIKSLRDQIEALLLDALDDDPGSP